MITAQEAYKQSYNNGEIEQILNNKKEPIVETNWNFMFGVGKVYRCGSFWTLSEGENNGINRWHKIKNETEKPARYIGVHESQKKFFLNNSSGKDNGYSVRCLRNY